MKLTKLGKALCMGALSAGVVFGVASCVVSYSVGYLYVTGTLTAQSGNNGIITAYKIDHNTGRLIKLNGFPVATGGANPVRAVLTSGSRFVYILNRGVNAAGNGDCTTANPCLSPNITEFAVGGNGILTYEQTFYTQGKNPFRLLVDGAGSYLFVLDHDAPDSNEFTGGNAAANSCTAALGSGLSSCGDITILKIDQTTGRLSTVVNAAVTSQNCPSSSLNCPLTYFPVPANPVDLVLTSNYALTLTGAPTPSSYPYTGGTAIWPYAYSLGQFVLSQNGAQTLGIQQGDALVYVNNVLYVLDNEPITISFNGNATTSASQILPFTIGGGGALNAEPSGIIPDDPTLANPSYLLIESKGRYVYVANQGNNTTGNNPESGLAGYFLTTSPAFQLSFIPDEPYSKGSGSGPQCIVEDPSDQYIYEANQFDSTITGQVLQPQTGSLTPLRVDGGTYSLPGQPTWCLIDGRTS